MKTLLFLLLILGLSPPSDLNRYPVRIDGKWGYINKKGIVVIPPSFKEKADFQNGFAIIIEENIDQRGKPAKVINTDGKIIYSFTYYSNYIFQHKFTEGLLAVPDKKTNKYGFINTKGEWVIPPIYHEVLDFSEGLAAVWEDANIHVDEWSGCGTAVTHSSWGYINKKGKYVIESQFYDATSFESGYAIINEREIINKEGKTIPISQINHRPTLIRKAGKTHSFLYKEDRWVPYNDENFDECYIEAEDKLKNKYGFLNENGEWAIQPQYNGVHFFKNNLAGIKNNSDKWGFINCNNEIIIEPQFEFVGHFQEGFAAIKLNDKWGFINRKGEIIVPPKYKQFEYLERPKFRDGLARLLNGEKLIYVNTIGEIIWKEK
jgi:hypothetical protein